MALTRYGPSPRRNAGFPAPYPLAVAPGCPVCPPCAVLATGRPPAPGKPYFYPLDEALPGPPGKNLLPGFPPFRPEDFVPEDEFASFRGLGFLGLGAVPGWLPPDQKERWKAEHKAAKQQMHENMQAGHAAHKAWKQAYGTPKRSCETSGGTWMTRAPFSGAPVPSCYYPSGGMSGFLGLGAGPDPNTMTCEKIISGYEKNALMASTRRADHAANAKARVAELEPFYNKCKGNQGITPDQPVDMHVLPGELGQGVPGATPAGWDMRTTGQPGGQDGSGAPGPFGNIDMKQVGIVAGAALGLVVLLAVLKKKKAKPA